MRTVSKFVLFIIVLVGLLFTGLNFISDTDLNYCKDIDKYKQNLEKTLKKYIKQ